MTSRTTIHQEISSSHPLGWFNISGWDGMSQVPCCRNSFADSTDHLAPVDAHLAIPDLKTSSKPKHESPMQNPLRKVGGSLGTEQMCKPFALSVGSGSSKCAFSKGARQRIDGFIGMAAWRSDLEQEPEGVEDFWDVGMGQYPCVCLSFPQACSET